MCFCTVFEYIFNRNGVTTIIGLGNSNWCTIEAVLSLAPRFTGSKLNIASPLLRNADDFSSIRIINHEYGCSLFRSLPVLLSR